MIAADRIAACNAPLADVHARELEAALATASRLGADPEDVIGELARFSVAAPSWALGTGGTRFGRFPAGGEPRTLEEKIDDVAALNALTGANRTISLHVPWDDPPDADAVRGHAADRDVTFDAMNSNTFQDNPATTDGGKVSYKFGSFAHTDAAVREAAVAHNLRCIELGDQLGSRALSIWLGDGANHPGQADFRGQFERVVEGLRRVHDHLPDGWVLFTEHKPFEPAFYATVNQDWGSSLLLAQAAGERARCLVDLGHHLPGANIEQIVSRLAMVGRLGGFHFNDSKYGDDDLTSGSVTPYQLFLIVCELVSAGDGRMPDLAYMLDQSANVKDPLEDLLQSTEAIHVALAQALLVDRPGLAVAQRDNDPAMAEEVLHAAFRSDVRPLVAEARRRNGAALRPLRAFRDLAYRRERIAERGESAVSTGL
ncbi:MAG: TIM barrel protein [Euzebyales bacterium]|jgi:L-rhamnose isomerase/sugar isomerase|nr:TIM barrel protein [Euzebyales bacterium]